MFGSFKMIYFLKCNRIMIGPVKGKLQLMICAECFGCTEMCETWQLSGLSALLSVVYNNS